MKKLMAALLSLTMALSLAACGGTNSVEEKGGKAQGENVQIPSPFKEYDTLEAAEAEAGYSFRVPESVHPDSAETVIYQVMDGGKLLEVLYRSDADEVIARKGPGSEDISGDYTAYAVESIADYDDGPSVTFRGDGTLNFLAIWTDGGYACSLLSRKGMEPEAFSALVNRIREGELSEMTAAAELSDVTDVE